MGETLNLAKLYNVTTQTIRDWKRRGAPFQSPEKMKEFIAGLRSRRFIGKRFRRTAIAEVHERADDLLSRDELADTITRMANDIDRASALLAVAREGLPADDYAKFQEPLELLGKWVEA